MSNLYKILGVKKTATPAEIKAAYRRSSKKMHPDAGGSAEAFAELKHAFDVLVNVARRARYDATGDAAEEKADNTHVALMSMLSTALDHVISLAAQQGAPLSRVDLVRELKILLGRRVEEMQGLIRDQEASCARLRLGLGRFSASEGEDVLGPILSAKIAGLDVSIAGLTAQRDQVADALRVVERHAFRFDPAVAPPTWQAMSPFVNITGA